MSKLRNTLNVKLLLIICLTLLTFGCTVIINPSKSDINIKQGETNIPCESGLFDFGNIPLGFSQHITFTIENIGKEELYLTGSPIIQIDGKDSTSFNSHFNTTDEVIDVNDSTDFTIYFSPISLGNKTAIVIIPNTDNDENPYTFVIYGTCTAPAPEIHVRQDTTDILCSTGIFDFGMFKVNTSSQHISFTIENNGNEDLILSGNPQKITISGTDTNMFLLNQYYVYSPIESGKSTKFEITFTPTSAGVKTAKISILNNDNDENPYTFTITGTGVASPEINILHESDIIRNVSGKYSFDSTLIDESSSEATFTIENLGTATLHLENSPNHIIITGNDASMFSVNLLLTDENIAPGSSTTFGVTFNPTSAGDKSATVSISNNDDDEDPYTFTILGEVLLPEINVKYRDDNIPHSTGTFDLGGVLVNNVGPEKELTIENLGNGNLKLNGSPLIEISGTNASEFSVNTGSTSTTIEPNKDTTFRLQCTPTSKGVKTATVSISNNDIDENPYTFTITAYGSSYTEGDVNGDGLVDFAVGGYRNDTGGTDAGKAYIFFGKSNWSASINASNANVIIVGENSFDVFGYSVSLVGDINKDGFEDVLISGIGAESVYIFFGRLNWSSNLDASDADVIISGDLHNDGLGFGVSEKADFNKDGIDDIMLGAIRTGFNRGRAIVFYGRQIWNENYTTYDADLGFFGEGSNDDFGIATSFAGDVNNDGYNDVVVSSAKDDVGRLYIFFGKPNMGPYINAVDADVKITGEGKDDFDKTKIASSSDINGDGIDDIVLGAGQFGSTDEGCVYIFWGKQQWPSTMSAGNADAKIVGISSGNRLGVSISTSGDVNKDGKNDLIIGATGANNGRGCAYIMFGKNSWSPLISPSNSDVILEGKSLGDYFGCSVHTLRDINSDGISDIIVGAEYARYVSADTGAACIFFGRQSWTSLINATNANVTLIGESNSDCFGNSVSPN